MPLILGTKWRTVMPVEIGYFTLQVKDIARAQRFYSALFGWDIEATPMGAHVRNTKPPIGFDSKGPANLPFVYFRVENIAAALKHLTELGGTVRERHDNPSGPNAICTDDQETVFSLWQPAPGFE
jgi:predicted enzyme related to lactoylglutathione lyase